MSADRGAPAAPKRAAHAGLRPAASTILITRQEGLKVLWVRRSDANPFLGGFHSFPGGRYDREDGPLGEDPAENLLTMARCAAREAFEETGLLIGFEGSHPPLEEQRRHRRDVLDGKSPFWDVVEGAWGLRFDASKLIPCGRWITPHFSRARFNTNFFLVELPDAQPPDVWAGELEKGEWIDPREAARLWDSDKVVMAMPTLHTIQLLAHGGHDLPGRLQAIPEANGIPSRHVCVRPGITMIPLKSSTLPPATHTNAVIVGSEDVVIIDPASADPDELEALHTMVRYSEGSRGKVRAILLTHRHGDHTAGVEAVRARYAAPVWAHEGVADRVVLDRAIGEGETIELPGDPPRRIRVIAAPGHSRSHLAFYEETSRTMIAGDVVSGYGTVVIAPPDGNLKDYMETLQRFQRIAISVLIPGHGPPQCGVHRLIGALIEHRRMREGRVLRALAEGPIDEEELRRRVYADTPAADPALALKTLRAHVEKLEDEGRVVREGERVRLA